MLVKCGRSERARDPRVPLLHFSMFRQSREAVFRELCRAHENGRESEQRVCLRSVPQSDGTSRGGEEAGDGVGIIGLGSCVKIGLEWIDRLADPVELEADHAEVA